MAPNYRNLIEPHDLSDWIPWEERFSFASVDKTPSGKPTSEPVGNPSAITIGRGKSGRIKSLGQCNAGLPHRWLNASGVQVKCAECRKTAMKHNLPGGTKIWTKSELRLKVEPRYTVPVCHQGGTHDWRAWDGTEESRRIRCQSCRVVVPGKLAGE